MLIGSLVELHVGLHSRRMCQRDRPRKDLIIPYYFQSQISRLNMET